MLAKHALYQLSYGPHGRTRQAPSSTAAKPKTGMVGPGRLELPTLRLSGVRSNQLSYGPRAPAHRACVVLGLAIAPVTLAVPGDEERETKTAAPRPEV